MLRLPQGPWFPWSREFRWDRLPWRATTRHERDSSRDQRELAALVAATSASIGLVVQEAGFTIRPDACGVSRRGGSREVRVLYEATAEDAAQRFEVLDAERGTCVDLWIYWRPDTGHLDLSRPGSLPPVRSQRAGRKELRPVLEDHSRELAESMIPDP